MRLGILAALGLTAVLASVAAAQNSPASPPTDLKMELTRKRVIVLPRPSDETVARDIEAATQQIEATQRRDRLIRESRERPLSRPELDSSIVNGIQAERALRALRR